MLLGGWGVWGFYRMHTARLLSGLYDQNGNPIVIWRKTFLVAIWSKMETNHHLAKWYDPEIKRDTGKAP